MPLTATQRADLLSLLEIPVNHPNASLVDQVISRVEASAGSEMVTKIMALVNAASALELQMQTSPGTGALIKADVLEWASGGVYKANKVEYRRLQLKVAGLLQLKWIISSGNTLNRGNGTSPSPWYNPIGFYF